ncbi:ferritin heavy chain B-like [Microtus pennsylvanicus]|uniref:ferritin heavy chain B-like n=1 Tax=Microtus pennsylvanicus TaxID=10058 RepID=UPI003F6C2BAD
MAPKKRAKVEIIPDESLTAIHQVACMLMNISDVYYFLSYYYNDEVAVAGFGAHVQDQAVTRWHEAKKSLKYITGRGNKVCLPDIQRPEMNNWDHVNCMTTALSMEKELTNVLQNLHASAFNIGDTETLKFVREFIPKQNTNEEWLEKEIAELKRRNEEAQT